MAKHKDERMSAKFLHGSLSIPYSYLRQVLSDLSKNRFITGLKGRNGGFILSKETNKIYLSDIIESTEGLGSFNKCIMGFDECPFNKPCSMHNIWTEARADIIRVLKNTTLSDLTDNVK